MRLHNLEIDRFQRLELAKLAARSTMEDLERYENSKKPKVQRVKDFFGKQTGKVQSHVKSVGGKASLGLGKFLEKGPRGKAGAKGLIGRANDRVISALLNIAEKHPGKAGATIYGAGILGAAGAGYGAKKIYDKHYGKK